MNNTIYYLYTLLVLGMALHSCQFPVDDYEQTGQLEFLKIEADVTPYFAGVKVVRTSAQLIGNAKKEEPVIPDEAYLLDGNSGARYDLPLNGDRDTLFKGKVGVPYTLHLAINGKIYESTPEIIRDVPDIDVLTYSFSTREDLPEANRFKHGFDVRLECRDLDQKGDYYHWLWTNYTKRYRCGTKQRFQTLYNLDCEVDCWTINYPDKVILFNDIYTNGVNISQPLTRVAYENYPKKYYLMVEQRAITKNVFTYLEAIKEQTESNGTPFDIPAQTQFSTNIRCTTDPFEKILGVFNTYNLKKRLIYVDRSGPIPGVDIKTDAELVRPTYLCAPPFPPPCKAPCQESYYVTQTKPEGWVD